MDSVNLIGAEDVRTAANTMRSAASEMRDAANTMDSSLIDHQRFMEDWITRFEAACTTLEKAMQSKAPLQVSMSADDIHGLKHRG